jgi:hypothetical protein
MSETRTSDSTSPKSPLPDFTVNKRCVLFPGTYARLEIMSLRIGGREDDFELNAVFNDALGARAETISLLAS